MSLTSAALVAILACGVVVASTVAPEQTQQVAGELKVSVEQIVDAGTLPTIRLAGAGGKHELDHAEYGQFIEMTSYRRDGVPPVYAAHNNRGGDVILGWSIGEQVDVVSTDGSTARYVVDEERLTTKQGDVEELHGMRGAIVVQTCFYGQNRIRFLGLTPIAPSAADSSATR